MEPRPPQKPTSPEQKAAKDFQFSNLYLKPTWSLKGEQLAAKNAEIERELVQIMAQPMNHDYMYGRFLLANCAHERLQILLGRLERFISKKSPRDRKLSSLTPTEVANLRQQFPDINNLIPLIDECIAKYRAATENSWVAEYLPASEDKEKRGAYITSTEVQATLADLLLQKARYSSDPQTREALEAEANAIYTNVIKTNIPTGNTYEYKLIYLLRKIAEKYCPDAGIIAEHTLIREDCGVTKSDVRFIYGNIAYELQLKTTSDGNSRTDEIRAGIKNEARDRQKVPPTTSIFVTSREAIDAALANLNKVSAKSVLGFLANDLFPSSAELRERFLQTLLPPEVKVDLGEALKIDGRNIGKYTGHVNAAFIKRTIGIDAKTNLSEFLRTQKVIIATIPKLKPPMLVGDFTDPRPEIVAQLKKALVQ